MVEGEGLHRPGSSSAAGLDNQSFALVSRGKLHAGLSKPKAAWGKISCP